MFKNLYVYLRYEKAFWFWLLQCVAGLIVVMFCGWLVLQSALAEALGLTRAQERASALQSALYWEFRGWKNSGLPAENSARHYGFINQTNAQGKLIITIADGENFVFKEVTIANLTDIKIDGLAAAAAVRKQTSATFDLYPNDRAVIWLDKKPWNVSLISDGLAKPTNNPTTNVVDLVFAEYFWSKFKGEYK